MTQAWMLNRMCQVRQWPMLLAAMLAVLFAATAADARTIILDARASDRMAGIAKSAPLQSWAMYPVGYGFHYERAVLTPENSLLLRFPLEQIPEGQRIAHAELIVPVITYSGTEPRFYLWRMLADWGVGVSYTYRKVEGDEKITWTKPGAGGISSDRATRPTDILRLTETGELAINVTEDVELWYTQAAPNNGWLFTVEDPGIAVHFYSPHTHGPMWKLRLTYEPL